MDPKKDTRCPPKSKDERKRWYEEIAKNNLSGFHFVPGGFRSKSGANEAALSLKYDAAFVGFDPVARIYRGKKWTPDQGKVAQKYNSIISTSKGDSATGFLGALIPVTQHMKQFWDQNKLSKNVTVVDVHNFNGGAAGVSIPFTEVQEDHPILINTGYLGGCTVYFGRTHNGLCVLHTGGGENQRGFSTMNEGMVALHYLSDYLNDPHYDEPFDSRRGTSKDPKTGYASLLTDKPNIGKTSIESAIGLCLDKHDSLKETRLDTEVRPEGQSVSPAKMLHTSTQETVHVVNYYQSADKKYGRGYCVLYKNKNAPNGVGMQVFTSADCCPVKPTIGSTRHNPLTLCPQIGTSDYSFLFKVHNRDFGSGSLLEAVLPRDPSIELWPEAKLWQNETILLGRNEAESPPRNAFDKLWCCFPSRN